MKKLQFFLLAAVAIVFAACSNDDVVLTDTGSGSSWNGGDGYIAISFKMANEGITRADNDIFKNGIAAEYAINDATLLLFYGTDEASAVFHSAYDLTGGTTSNANSDGSQITLYDTFVQEISTDGIATTDNIYALAVLNKGDMMTITGNGTDALIHIGDTEISAGLGSKITDMQKAVYTASTLTGITDATGTASNGFFMTNAPLATTQGGSSTVAKSAIQVLAPVVKDNIYKTKDEAATATNLASTEIYVERGVAKVTVCSSNKFTSGVYSSITPSIDLDGNLTKIELVGYLLDRTNTKMYAVRNVEDPNNTNGWWGYMNSDVNTTKYSNTYYRMVGSSSVGTNAYKTGTTSTNLYRTY